MSDAVDAVASVGAVPAAAERPVRVGVLALAREGNGGTLPYTRSMLEALRSLPKSRYRITVYTERDNVEYDDLRLPVVRLREGWWSIVRSAVFRDAFQDEDCVVAPIYSTRLLGMRAPFAFTLHDLQEKYYPEYFTAATRVWRHLANRLLTARAALVICESEFVRRDICAHFSVPRERIAVVPAPPVSQLASAAPAIDEGELLRQLDVEAPYVFYPAQFWPHKNHVRLVEAFSRVSARFPDCQLVLTGKQRDEYHRVFERVRQLGLESRVRHVGHVSASQLAALYRRATVTAVPTLFESISIPVYEAFALGSPVCASNVVALPEQVGDAGLLFDPLSVEGIADAIERLLADESLRKELADRGRRRMQSMTTDRYAARLADVVRTMVDARRGD